MQPLELERFMRHVEVRGDCWIWSSTLRHGYGAFQYRGRSVIAHRLAYEHFIGPIPEGLTIDHVIERGCTSTACVNPAHLEAITRHENILRGTTSAAAVNARRTHCIRGHLFDEVNTRITPDGRRYCRECARMRRRARRARLLAATAATLAAATLTATTTHAATTTQQIQSLRSGIQWERARAWHWQHVAGIRRSPTIRGAALSHSVGYLRWIERKWERRRMYAYKMAHRPAYRTLSSGPSGSLRAYSGCLAPLIDREDPTWDPTKYNTGGSGAYGLPQALPGSKMASAGPDWQTNPYTQIRWMRGYVNSRYGGCAGALAHSYAYGWY